MEFRPEKQTVQKLVQAWDAGSLTRNPEYQRGAAWTKSQKQALIDSLFRAYPIPPIFLERKSSAGLFGSAAEKYEIIDGQQRILALAEYCSGEFPLLTPTDEKLRLPHSLRAKETPWGGKTYEGLRAELARFLNDVKIDVILVENVQNPDEVRDLFIRLQSGTALTRQQIRDAWPGGIAPLVETFAGKLQKQPKYRLFQAVDARGLRDEEKDPRDSFVAHRQSCAQLMRLLVARASDPRSFPSVRADDVDSFYHEHTDYTSASPMVQEIEQVFGQVQEVTDQVRARWSGKKKIPKLSLFALAFFFQDMRKNTYWKLDRGSAERLAEYAANVEVSGKARTTDGPKIREFYEGWVYSLPTNLAFGSMRSARLTMRIAHASISEMAESVSSVNTLSVKTKLSTTTFQSLGRWAGARSRTMAGWYMLAAILAGSSGSTSRLGGLFRRRKAIGSRPGTTPTNCSPF